MKEVDKNLKNITIILIVIAGLLLINTSVLLFNGTNSTKENTTTEEEGTYDVSMFNQINATEFLSTIKNSKTQVIYLGRPSCGYCVKFLPSIQKAQKDLKYTTSYVDISSVDTTSKDYETMVTKINGLTDKFNESHNLSGTNAYEYLYGYTPLVVLAKDGKLVDVWVGYSEYESFITWLNDNGVK